MRRMTGAGEQVLASICLFPIKIRIDLASTDTEGCVKEGDGILGGAGAAVWVRVGLLLRVLDGELDGAINCINVTVEAV